LCCDGSWKRLAVPVALAGAAKYRAPVNFSCWKEAFVLNNTSLLNTHHGRPGRYTSLPMPSLWWRQRNNVYFAKSTNVCSRYDLGKITNTCQKFYGKTNVKEIQYMLGLYDIKYINYKINNYQKNAERLYTGWQRYFRNSFKASSLH
jgi:hypothetical protein